MRGKRFLIAGGAGFIGSHFCERLLGDAGIEAVTLFDNFSSGREWHYAHLRDDARLRVVRGDIKDLRALREAVGGHDVVIHLASNPDIARAAMEPDIDFREGTFLTQQVLEAMRQSGVRRILYASGSGVYGDIGFTYADEVATPMQPVSTYGASKLAGEALIRAYCSMFGFTGCAFRFANVVGPRQTHGVGLDFVGRLLADPTRLRILGDGKQSKSYIHVSDIVNAVLLAHERSEDSFAVFNVATEDYVEVIDIAHLAFQALGIDPAAVRLEFTGGSRGWAGDVPVVRLKAERIGQLGWRCQHTAREALLASLAALVTQLRKQSGGPGDN